MSEHLKKCAEILVEIGYASSYEIDKREHLQHSPPVNMTGYDQDGDAYYFNCNPYADTLEGRRQACSAIDHIRVHHNDLWNQSRSVIVTMKSPPTWWKYQLARLRWCIDQIGDDNG